MRCPSCRADNLPEATSCHECGDALAQAADPVKTKIIYPIAQAQDDEDNVMDVLSAAKPNGSTLDKDGDPSEGDGGISTLIPYRNPKALAAYYLGFFSLICVVGVAPAPFAIVLGIMGVLTARANPEAKGTVHAWIGIVFGVLSLVGNAILITLLLNQPID
ncbi:MAG TPA: hypothetical protein VGP68_02980 [Gemmataceae bacterium]|jgi:hypothetical protein|nr:hypothetical protein [Gemmataceae bacterium]